MAVLGSVEPVGLLIIPLGLLFLFASILARRAQERALCDWIASHRLTDVSLERRTFFRGPFFLTASKSAKVYRLYALDASGWRVSGYVCVGAALFGTASVSVKWDWPRPELWQRGFPVVFNDRAD